MGNKPAVKTRSGLGLTKVTVLLLFPACFWSSVRGSPDGVTTLGLGKFAKSRALPHIFLVIAILPSLAVALAQNNAASTDDYVSRTEYEKLKSELETLKAQMAQLMKNQTQQPPAERPSGRFKAVTSPQSEVNEAAIFPSRQD